jgi:hypothetical protein
MCCPGSLLFLSRHALLILIVEKKRQVAELIQTSVSLCLDIEYLMQSAESRATLTAL